MAEGRGARPLCRWLPRHGLPRALALLAALLLLVAAAANLRLLRLWASERPLGPAAPGTARDEAEASARGLARSCVEQSEGRWPEGAAPAGNRTLRFAELRGVGCADWQRNLVAHRAGLARPACERACGGEPRCRAYVSPGDGKPCVLFGGGCAPFFLPRALYLGFESPIEACLGEAQADALGAEGVLRSYAAWEERSQRRARFVDGLDANLWAAFFLDRETEELRRRLARGAVGLHPYWSLLGAADEEMKLDDLFVARTLRMRRQLPRDDFKVEKSKCTMGDYFRRAGLPQPELLRTWSDPASFLREARLLPLDAFPAMIKFCHLTQGTQGIRNTRFVASRAQLEGEHAEELEAWVLRAWNATPRDNDRPWSHFGINTMLRGLERGILWQRAWPTFPGLGTPAELKISCVWGRCVLGRLEQGGGGGGQEVEFVFREGRVQRLDAKTVRAAAGAGGLFREGGALSGLPDYAEHVRAAFRLAERDAQLLQADFIRVDVFLNPDDPRHPVINEHSIYEISQLLGIYAKHLADLWLLGYSSGRVSVRHSAARTPLYMLGG